MDVELKIEKIRIVERPRKLVGEWTVEFHDPTPEEQEEINRDCGMPACEHCGSHCHSTEAHEILWQMIQERQ